MIYGSLIKSRTLNKDEFVRKALLEFAEHRWGSGGFGRTIKLHSEESQAPARFILSSQFAKRLGIHPRTVERLIKDGIISSRTIQIGKRNRKIVDSRAVDIVPVTPGTIFRRRTAAAMIGIPVRLLDRLKKDGLYKSKHLPSILPGFHEDDILEFTTSLRMPALSNSAKRTNSSSMLTISNALHRVRFCVDLQVQLIDAILSHRLSICSGSRKPAMELLVDEQDFDGFVDTVMNELWGATETYQSAAVLLRCDNMSVAQLIRQGLLTTVVIGSSKRISHESIAAFEKKYMPLSMVANDLDTSSRALMRWCEEHRVFMLTILHQSR